MTHPMDGNGPGDAEELRELYAETFEEVSGPISPTHECMSCGNVERINDEHQRYTPLWCDWCNKMRTFKRIEYDD